jgi:hypothetical protein
VSDVLERRLADQQADDAKEEEEVDEASWEANDGEVPRGSGSIPDPRSLLFLPRSDTLLGADLLGLYIEAAKKRGETPSHEEMCDVILNFLIAGRDTTAWVFCLACVPS